MNYLKQIMEAEGISPIQLAEMSGCNIGTVRNLMKADSIEYAFKGTIKKLSKALGVTPRDLVKGGKRMKNKILYTEVTKAAEALSKALRAYTDEPMYLSVCVFTQDKTAICDGDPEGIPDYYSIRCHNADDIEGIVPTISESARVYYGEDGIKVVKPYHREVADDDSQN